MAEVYQSSARASEIPELGDMIHGGLAVVVRNPSEIDGLLGLCWNLSIQETYREFLKLPTNLAEGENSWSTVKEALVEDWGTTDPTWLGEALYIAQGIWLAQKEEEIGLLRLVVLIPQDDGSEDKMTVEVQRSAFAIRADSLIGSGPLIGDIVSGTFRTRNWLIYFAFGEGTTPAARSGSMVRRLRETALKKEPQLQDIHSLVGPPSRPLVVLIHGLFGTDVGTFKALQPLLEKHFHVVGFPHDSVSKSVGANGRELAQHLGTIACDKIHLVAHSRGGLVARSAIAQLKKSRPHRNIRSCITFGTPHLGAELAENPGKLIWSFACLNAVKSGNPVTSLLDILCCHSIYGDLPGIRDLRPASVAQLEKEEGGLYPDELVDLFAVGGAIDPKNWWDRIAASTMRGIIGNTPNDFVVRQDSSLPMLGRPTSQRQSVECSHSGYFEHDQESILKQAVDFLLRS